MPSVCGFFIARCNKRHMYIRLWCKRSCTLHISNTVKRNQNPFEVTCRRRQFFRKSMQERPSRLSRRREARYPRHRYGADLHNDSRLFVAKRCVTVGRWWRSVGTRPPRKEACSDALDRRINACNGSRSINDTCLSHLVRSPSLCWRSADQRLPRSMISSPRTRCVARRWT